MLELLSENKKSILLSFSMEKKLSFLIFLYERMIPELIYFFAVEKLDISLFDGAREKFWLALSGDEGFTSWGQLRERLLDALPDSENVGTIPALFALNAGLVAANIAGFIEGRQDQPIIEAIGYARNSIDAKATNERQTTEGQTFVYDRTVEEEVKRHPLVRKERQREEEDLLFLSVLQEPPWSWNVVSMLRQRAQTQGSMFGTRR